MTKQEKRSLDFRIGEKVLVDVEGTGRRFWTEAYGRIQEEFILLRHPMNASFKDLLNKDQPITARYMDTQGSIFGFKSTVVWHHLPALAHPGHHPSLHRGVGEPAPARPGAVLPALGPVPRRRGDARLHREHFRGRGQAGLAPRQRGRPEFPKTPRRFCQFRLPGADGELYARSIIKSTTLDENKCIIGLKFEDLEEENKRIITDYVQLAMEFMAS